MRAEGPKPEALEGEAEEEDIWMDSPPADQQQKFANSPPEEEAILQECAVKKMCHYRQTLSMCQMGPSNLCHLRRKRSSENISTLGM